MKNIAFAPPPKPWTTASRSRRTATSGHDSSQPAFTAASKQKPAIETNLESYRNLLPVPSKNIRNRRRPSMVRLYLGLRKWLPAEWLIRPVIYLQQAYNLWHYHDFNFPRSFSIEVSAHCNRRCYYCPQSVSPIKPRLIEQRVYIKALERIAELNWRWALDFHFYSEPLLVRNLEDYVRQAKEACPKAALRIISNGDLLTEERFQSLRAAGIVYFNITRHPPYTDTWDHRISALISKHPQFVRSSTIENRPLSNRTGLVAPKQVADLSEGCMAPSAALTITIDGDYMFCCCDYFRKHPLGNIFNVSALEAWGRPDYAKVRQEVQKGRPTIDVCKACFGFA